MRTPHALGCALAIALVATSAGELRADEKQAEKEFRLGQKQFDAKDFRGALKHYEAAFEAAEIPALIFNIAQCHRNLGEYRKAARKFRAYMEAADEPENADEVERTLEQLDILRKAQKHVRARRYEQAIELFDNALELEQLAPIHRDRGRSLERVGKYDEALDSYRDYLAAQPEAEDSDEVQEAIARLEKELAGPPIVGGPSGEKPIYKKWWFWGGVAGALAAALVVTAVATDDGVPSSDLGNIPF